MLCLNNGLFFGPKDKLGYFSAWVFQQAVILLLLTDSFRGQSQGVGASQTIVAVVGEDVILPCHLEPAADVVSKSLEWGRPDLEPRFVHVWHEGQNLLVNQNPSYKGRTSLSIEKLRHGDLSLKLSAVKHSDNGIYRCYFPSQDKESTVELVVGSVSSPVLAGIYLNSSVVILNCDSEGWYPEPEVFWLDGEGNLLSAGPTETVRGPDDLYTVSSRVTVEKRHSNSFTCRVQQKDINQIRETHIQVTADCFVATSTSAARVSIIVVVVLIFSLAGVFLTWKWRQNQTKETKMHHEAETEKREREQLVAQSKEMEDLEEKKAKLEEELQKKEEEQKDLEQVVNILMEQSKELQNQRDQLQHQKEDMEKNMADIENKIQSVEKMAESDRAQGYYEMKSITLTAKRQLVDRKQEDAKLHLQTQTLLNKTNGLLDGMTDRKKEVENHKEKINEQLEEIQRKLQTDERLETRPVKLSIDNNV
ncbi:butyrophilin subfamily 1 member A1-like [Micropterus salmoides]|uniref:butyrophilin subfamily 1 member A1-like n=1 Tax=Micropterus salmoides TaxID=27706 RepID=UPI0018EC0C80|nr:butyrophilin subfamily 1 member A1-like [Micropterus salmoides]